MHHPSSVADDVQVSVPASTGVDITPFGREMIFFHGLSYQPFGRIPHCFIFVYEIDALVTHETVLRVFLSSVVPGGGGV